jgi:hypothetical protein
MTDLFIRAEDLGKAIPARAACLPLWKHVIL